MSHIYVCLVITAFKIQITKHNTSFIHLIYYDKIKQLLKDCQKLPSALSVLNLYIYWKGGRIWNSHQLRSSYIKLVQGGSSLSLRSYRKQLNILSIYLSDLLGNENDYLLF